METKKTANPIEISGPFQRLIPEIFNPYEVCSFEQKGIEPCNIKSVAKLSLKTIGSDGTLYGAASLKTNVFIYKVSASYTLFFVDEGVPFYTKDERKSSHHALAFFDKHVMEDQENSKYYFHRIGRVENKDAVSAKGKWTVIPREFFADINDYVYLFLCCTNADAPTVKAYQVPLGQPFFWDLPVATAIYEGQKLNTSKILLGRIMELPVRKPIGSVIVGKPVLKRLDKYTWNSSANKAVRYDDNKVYHEEWTTDYTITHNGKKYRGPSIKVCVFRREKALLKASNVSASRRKYAEPITAFVWRSGNEDDAVKKSYLVEDPYNSYPFIHDSLSSTTIFGSLVTLTKLPIDNAARYIVRVLAQQCPGHRSFSIDADCLVYLMGGVIYRAESIVVAAYKDNERELTAEEIEHIDRLFELNGNHLFFDSPILYNADTDSEDVYYLKDVLGIGNGSNGCETLYKLLEALFSGIASYGINIDYLYSDIEGPWNEARPLASRRFGSGYLSSEASSHDFNSGKFYHEILWKEVINRKDIADRLLHRGFFYKGRELKDVYAPKDDPNNKYSLYGIHNSERPYYIRRNVNIWDAVMKGYSNNLFHEYVFKPVLKSHPKAKCSVFAHGKAKGYVNCAGRFETYLGGTVVQDSNIYSNGALYGDVSSEGYKKLYMDNWRMYPNEVTPFSYFIGNINKLRSLLVSSQDKKNVNGKFNAFISSYNIWINGYLSDERKYNDVLAATLERYYKEYLYHIFLCCPDKAIAYFNIEKTAIEKDGLTDEGGTYLFPYNDPERSKEEQYYQDSYQRLHEVLLEMNARVLGRSCKTTVKELATETDPFVISGMTLSDNTTLWRITWDETCPCTLIHNKQELTIMSSAGRQICFTKVVNKNDLTGKNLEKRFGIWVVAPKGILPEISSDKDYYERKPALFAERPDNEDYPKDLEIGKGGNHLDYNRMNNHTVFGESPKFQTWAIQFKVNREQETFTRLLWTGNFMRNLEDPKSRFEIVIGKREDVTNGLILSSWKAEKEISKIYGELEIGKTYELKLYLALYSELTEEIINGKVRYELWDVKDKKADKMLFFDESDIVKKGNESTAFFFSSICAFYPYIKEDVTVEVFKCYFTQQHEKLELFRESDGVNIGRVNKNVAAYTDLPVETSANDTLVAKLSWVNASEEDVRYKITYYQDGTAKRLNASEAVFIAKAGSEGYRLITLPAMKAGVKQVKLKCVKSIANRLLPVKRQSKTFFTDFFDSQKEKEIVVDITAP